MTIFSSAEIDLLALEPEYAFIPAAGIGTYGLCPLALIDANKSTFELFHTFLHDSTLHEIDGRYVELPTHEFAEINNQVEFEINSAAGKSRVFLPHFFRVFEPVHCQG